VSRSALALKLLTSRAHGSLVAAPTFGLPEEIGGVRNWDYRYTWIRDASFTMYALIRLGFHDEARDFSRWVQDRCAEADPAGSLQVVYGLDGRRDLTEENLPHLRGYRGSRPVRIGNAAYAQLQLDIYGELLDAIYLADRYAEPIHYDLWLHVVRLVDWVCANWRRPDEGIWEVRLGRRHFLYSRIQCWVAIDRAIRLARRRSLPCDAARWEAARDAVFRDVFDGFWDAERGAFVQSVGSKTIDAAALLMPLFRMVSPTDPRWLSTLRAIETDLVEDSLVYRYRNPDGLVGGEGTFSSCTFWYAENLSRAGHLGRARVTFEKMLAGARQPPRPVLRGARPCGEHLGNFPQAFTHLALISAAYDLDRRLSAAGHP
jgi:GH15 family glucan-1,4-alpha-glucosidase